VRAIAESLGRRPPASKYSPDLSYHFAYGSKEVLDTFNKGAKTLL